MSHPLSHGELIRLQGVALEVGDLFCGSTKAWLGTRRLEGAGDARQCVAMRASSSAFLSKCFPRFKTLLNPQNDLANMSRAFHPAVRVSRLWQSEFGIDNGFKLAAV